MNLKFMSLASGSSGNCFYLGTTDYGLLFDAGIGVRTIKKRLSDAGLSINNVRAVFLTHDHIDHSRSAGILSEKCFLPVYATQKTYDGINNNPVITNKVRMGAKLVEKDKPFTLDDFTIEAFGVSHDSFDCIGYTVIYKGKRFTLATDLGYICENAKKHITEANYLVIEANYDEKMLDNGNYPYFLKERIKGNSGHLSNDQTADFLAENINGKLSHIWTCHLSKENNSPTLVYNTIAKKLLEKNKLVGKDIHLRILPRTNATELFEL